MDPMHSSNANAAVSSAPAAAAARRHYQRRARNIFIHKPMQREFTFVLIALLMISIVAIGFVINQTIKDAAMGDGFRFGKLNAYEVLSDLSYQLILRVSAVLFATLIVVGTFGIFFLHRVAGPVYRFRKVFMRINEGEMPPLIKLREGDFFSETAQEINRLVKKMNYDKQKHKRIRENLVQMMGQSPPESQKLIKETQRILDEEPLPGEIV